MKFTYTQYVDTQTDCQCEHSTAPLNRHSSVLWPWFQSFFPDELVIIKPLCHRQQLLVQTDVLDSRL